MKIAITGGAGFIGSAVVAAAESQGHDVWICDRESGCDILQNLDQLGGAESVIHLAGLLGTHELFDQVEDAVMTNVVGSLRVMQWCLKHDASYTGILMPDVFPSVYTATKVASKRLADALHHSAGLKVSHVRAYNAYGPGQKHGPHHPQKIVPTFATKAWAGEPIPVWGDGTQVVDLVHVDDLGRMLVDATRFVDNEVFDGGSGSGQTVNEVAEFINLLTNNKAGIDYLPMRRGEIPSDEVYAKGEGWDALGWRPLMHWGKLGETVHSYRPL